MFQIVKQKLVGQTTCITQGKMLIRRIRRNRINFSFFKAFQQRTFHFAIHLSAIMDLVDHKNPMTISDWFD